MTVDQTRKLFGSIKVYRLATLGDLRKHRSKLVPTVESGRGVRVIRRVSGNRHRYYFCRCVLRGRAFIIRSDKLASKICRCRRAKTPAPVNKPAIDTDAEKIKGD